MAYFHDRLSDLGLELPPPPKAVAMYTPAAQAAGMLYISGQLPLENGRIAAVGKLGQEVTLEEGQHAARQCVLNGLAAIDQALHGDWDNRFDRVVRLGVFVASTSEFTDQHLVANGASELVNELFPGRQHARAAVGCPALPLDAAVEVELLVQLR